MRVISKDTTYKEALERAVAILTEKYPDRGQRMRKTLDLVTQDIVTHPDPARAWSYSCLNGDGSPVELTFSSLDDDVRYAVEVAGPDVFAEDRLGKVSRLLSTLAPEASFAEIVTEFEKMQAGATLRWGAWLGIRHKSDREEYKIYAEAPKSGSSGAEELIARYLGDRPSLSGDRQAQLVSVGQTLGSARREFYFELSGFGLEEEEIAHLLHRFDLQQQQGDLLALMRGLRKVLFSTDNDSSPLPNAEYAFSCSVLPGGKQPVLSIFTMAGDYLGGDALIRYALMVTGYKRGWPFETYSILTEAIGRQVERCAHHNVIAFIVAPNAETGLHISLSPPFPE